MKIKYLFIFSTFLACMACEENFEYKVYPDPVVSISFINQDTISSLKSIVETSTVSIDSGEDLLDNLDSSLSAISDSITAITLAQDSGNFTFDDILSALRLQFSEDSTNQATINTEISDNQILIDSINVLIAVFETGNIKLDFFKTNFDNTTIQTYEDSLETYEIPLNVAGNQSKYEFGISRDTFSISLSHDSEEFITADLGIKLSIFSIELLQHDFDSVLILCVDTTNCSAYETSLVCYY